MTLCKLLSQAMLSGQLAVALEELKMKSEDIKATDVAAIKALAVFQRRDRVGETSKLAHKRGDFEGQR